MRYSKASTIFGKYMRFNGVLDEPPIIGLLVNIFSLLCNKFIYFLFLLSISYNLLTCCSFMRVIIEHRRNYRRWSVLSLSLALNHRCNLRGAWGHIRDKSISNKIKNVYSGLHFCRCKKSKTNFLFIFLCLLCSMKNLK